jgi:NAD(P)-dependent dehydrogenase (short-subunit alcohol dehydrogenase family)
MGQTESTAAGQAGGSSHSHASRQEDIVLSGKVCCVFGATGIIGSGAVHNFLQQGATVVAVSRTETKLKALLDKFPDQSASGTLLGVVGSFNSKSEVEQLFETIQMSLGETVGIDHVVSSLGFATLTPSTVGFGKLSCDNRSFAYAHATQKLAFQKAFF